MKKYIIINNKDNVMVALEDLKKGDFIDNLDLTICEDINKGHKVAICDILPNTDIIKYGYAIGKAKTIIKKGELVHIHNLITNLNENHEFNYIKHDIPNLIKTSDLKVSVYLRKNGEVGIRNHIVIVPTVGCINGLADIIVEEFRKKHPICNNYDGIFVVKHPYGCSQMGDDHVNTRSALQNIVKHPNFGGVLVLGLGCENNQISEFEKTLCQYDKDRIKFLNAQSVKDEIKEALDKLETIWQIVETDQRTYEPLAKINIGLKCGGSDGFSGLTGNPLIGRIADYIIENGGSAVLTEIPEMFGAEEVLLKRVKDKDIYERLLKCINDFKNYYLSNNQVIYENPSPGNKAGGITTLEEKSLGCVQKSGKNVIVDVLQYTDLIKTKGLNILTAPGNDLVASTALGMCGCQLVLFSTGRGTPFGTFVPTLKIATNSDLYLKKNNWIDFNSGDITNSNYDNICKNFIEYIIEVIEGKLVKNEINNFREIAIFKTGVTL